MSTHSRHAFWGSFHRQVAARCRRDPAHAILFLCSTSPVLHVELQTRGGGRRTPRESSAFRSAIRAEAKAAFAEVANLLSSAHRRRICRALGSLEATAEAHMRSTRSAIGWLSRKRSARPLLEDALLNDLASERRCLPLLCARLAYIQEGRARLAP